ncbi:hypothetical protein CBOM_07888 [Ceraceosorus bombacis]|uniref:Uncharacterized protein n=1 Tax=Ceraceosorus bombacis TaxID=401625 RepID=A0A0P1BIH5_9BASI|nr:hypothetical protein CBOM_07888 [Ceraceosorus bombacis]
MKGECEPEVHSSYDVYGGGQHAWSDLTEERAARAVDTTPCAALPVNSVALNSEGNTSTRVSPPR